MFKKLFCYACRVTGVLANLGTSTQQINISNDNDFELREIRTTGTSGVFLTVQYATGEQMSNISLNAGLIGAGQNALKLLEPVMIPRNSQLSVLVDNQSGGGVTNFEVEFWGIKIN